MKNYVPTSQGPLFFDLKELKQKPLSRDQSKENLLDARQILSNSKVTWGIIYGTLLGAIRESDFIAHDTDTDIFVFEEQRQSVLDSLPVFLSKGFEIARYEKVILSIIRNEEYIDFYFFKKSPKGRRAVNLFAPQILFSGQGVARMCGIEIPTVANPEEFLRCTYGQSWNVPIAGRHAEPHPIWWKRVIEKLFPEITKRIGTLTNRPKKL